ncbi:MAG: HIT family hydrolase [Ignavibacteria bacterium RBG_16_34_14]|nr:MAG: HIT family hydrolase [Ignavibacteria bacterium RBG_16_34_14]
MNKLWSPWRSQYIDSFLKEKPAQCILCELSKQNPEDAGNLLVDKGELTFTILNLYPYNNGHLMIIPFDHKKELGMLTQEENAEIMQKLNLAVKALTSAIGPEGFNIGVNLGKCAGAGIDEHIHFHVVPRWNGDTNFMPVLGEVKVISQDLLQTKQKLFKAYQKIKQEIDQHQQV